MAVAALTRAAAFAAVFDEELLAFTIIREGNSECTRDRERCNRGKSSTLRLSATTSVTR